MTRSSRIILSDMERRLCGPRKQGTAYLVGLTHLSPAQRELFESVRRSDPALARADPQADALRAQQAYALLDELLLAR